MSMFMVLETATDDAIARMLADPAAYTSRPQAELNVPAPASGDTAEHFAIDLDKAWGAISFLLTGRTFDAVGPKAFLVSGGVEISGSDEGLGPARALSSSEVASIAQALADITPEKFRADFDHEALERNSVYPSGWDPGDPEEVEYVVSYYESMWRHLGRVARKKLGLLVFLS